MYVLHVFIVCFMLCLTVLHLIQIWAMYSPSTGFLAELPNNHCCKATAWVDTQTSNISCACLMPAGVSGIGVFFIVLITMGMTAGGMYGVYQMVVKQRMKDDMRNILEEYVPLNSAPVMDPYVRSAPSPAPNLNNV
jgi:hypothetical protein